MLLFSPELCGSRDPLATLAAALPWVDVVQIRPKPASPGRIHAAPCAARDVHEWCARVLDLVDPTRTLVIVDDRVDVAAALSSRGCAGVHLGQDDCPVSVAREMLGADALVGLSTHTMEQVVEGAECAVDYLGFGPVHATATKGYERGLGADACWLATLGTTLPVFAIGGIDATNVGELARVGRVAVSSAILAAEDPGRAARELRGLLVGDE
ncbi:MAG: thiamine phosphate synthase [Planctomycetota bacterium]